mmetsp:Transcript_2819/g.4821  ORF Transcript_2819/g.4821 Transcript_2819/m.4821 type:complete len:97 (+) Transcript_2819:63-353(+)
MGFSDGCCGLCAWFSVIGAVTYFTLAQMVMNRNQPVIEHKFKMRFNDNDEQLGEVSTKMIEMSIIMICASLLCFFMQSSFASKELREEKEAKLRQK